MYQLLILLLVSVLCNSQELTASIRLVKDATVELELSNTATYGIAVLHWHLPLDERFESDTFRVLFQDEPVGYIGPRVKYAGPFVDDYVFFAPNETKKYTIRLENAYDFSKPGDYDVVFVTDVMDYETDGGFHSLPHTRSSFIPLSGVISNSLKFSTSTELYQKIVRAPYPCSQSENNQINNAHTAERTMIGYAFDRINQGQSSQYTEWFGTYVASRFEAVRNNIGWIRADSNFIGNCDDRANVYAYVYPTDNAHNIYFCSAFWPAANAGGYDTKAGTIIHELSHFNNIAGTNDWAYGTSACRNLASSNPARAIANADNYEYFCESEW